ncbi:MAG: spore germination protein [Agathobacter sp.]|nr:spore germination protein [Agathobacter sp.]
MYTDNQKISRRQVFRLFFFDFLGIGTIILPGLLAQEAENYGLVSIGIGGVAGLFYLLYLSGCCRILRTDLQSFLKDRGRFERVKRIAAAVLAFTAFMGAGFVGAVLADMVKKSLIGEEAYAVIWVLTLLAAIYAVCSGLETRARVYEVLFWFVIAPLLFMLLLAAKGMEASNFTVGTKVHAGAVVSSAYPVFLVFGSMFALMFLPGRVTSEKKEKLIGKTVVSVAAAYVLALAIVLFSYIVLLGNFGSKSLAQMKYPIVTLMSAIRIEGGFFKRLDALMLSVWFFTLFALLCMQLYYGGQMLACVFKEEHKKREHVAAYIIVFVIGLLLGKEAGLWVYADRFFRYIQGPVYVIIPGMCAWMKDRTAGGNRMDQRQRRGAAREK